MVRLQSPGPPLFSASRPARRPNSNSSSASTRRIPILTARLTEAARAIGEQSAGRLGVTVFPNTSSAAIPRRCRSFVPAASSYWRRPRCRYRRWYHCRAFPVSASPSSPYDRVWAAMDGWVGDIVRDGHRKGGLVPMRKKRDNGFRHITSSSIRQLNGVEDLRGSRSAFPSRRC